jgi:hypothetical protein
MRIEVTEQDIAAGRRRQPSACPIALAVKRAYAVERASVAEYDIIVTRWCDRQFKWRTPTPAASFIERFDKGEKVEPFSFELPD